MDALHVMREAKFHSLPSLSGDIALMRQIELLGHPSNRSNYVSNRSR